MASKYDIIVIGGGPGGYVAAIRASQLGMRVALVERNSLGGTCLNIGCIPSKALLDSSEHYYTARADGELHGMRFTDLSLDLAAMMRRKDKVVSRLVGGVSGLMHGNKIEVIEGTGEVKGDGVVLVDSQQLYAKHVILATGSTPQHIPPCPVDGTHIITSTEALSLSKVPKRLLVVGGGAIGLEMGSVWQRLGAEVIVCEVQTDILPSMDRQVGHTLRRALERQGMQFLCRSAIQSATVKDNTCYAVIRNPDDTEQSITCDKILVAVGRRPYTKGLGLEQAGVTVDEQGFVDVDETYLTTAEGIYAIGDLISRGPMLAHKAEDEGVAVVELIAGRAGHVNYATIPNVVYTEPEVATVGFLEHELEAGGLRYRAGTFPISGNGRASAMNVVNGYVSVFADATTDQVLGVQMVCPRASDLIAEAAIVMEFGGSAEDIARTMHAHPTISEAFREAALAVDRRALHMM